MPGHIVNPAAQPASPSGQSNAPDKTGAFNGALSHNRGLSSSQSSPLANMRKSYRTNGRITSSSSVEESTLTIQRRSYKELGATISDKVYSTDYITLVEWIHNERLLSLPKEGSGWDKVLVWAQTLADRVNGFSMAIESFTGGSNMGSQLAYGHFLILLELGSENSEALGAAFGLFNSTTIALAALLDRSELFEVSTEVREQLAMSFTDVLRLFSNVAIRYRRTVTGMTSVHSSLDLYSAFSSVIKEFRARCIHISTLMWRYQMKQSGYELEEGLEPKDLRVWLGPHDHILADVSSDHMTLANSREEMTCLWIEPHLANFVNSKDKVLAVTGRPGSGKTVLAGSIFERLQRPVARKSYSTLFASINQRIPAEATSLCAVKSLLLQLLEQRIGNTQLYSTLIATLRRSRQAVDKDAYEELLWNAFSDVVGATLQGANDLIVLVDGLDEAQGDANCSKELFSRLRSSCANFDNVKLITFSQSNAVPSENIRRVDASLSNVGEDVAAVARKTLSKSKPFQSLDWANQEILLQRIVNLSDGSFLWTKLFTKLIDREKTIEDFTKILQNSEKKPSSITDLISLHIQVNEPEPISMSILSYLLLAERPLSLTELRSLLQTDPSKAIVTSGPIDILHYLRPIVSLVFVADDLVYIRHGIIRHTIDDLIRQKRLSLPVKYRHVDFISRLLTFTKSSLQEDREPSFISLDAPTVDVLFQKSPLLEYTTRYWPLHFKHSSMYKQNAEPSLENDFKQSFPSVTTLALLEKTCWDEQLPAPVNTEWNTLSQLVRRMTIGENQPATLQSTINCALTYEAQENIQHATTYYYAASKISHAIYSSTHTLTMDCSNSFLRLTNSLNVTSRNTITSQREYVLSLLIEAYKIQRQTNMLVEMQRTLVSLYTQIDEKSRAEDITRLMNQTTTEVQGSKKIDSEKNSRDLSVDLKQRKRGDEIRTIDFSLFGDEELEEQARGFDTMRLKSMQQDAYTLTQHGNVVLAERTWVELWSHVAEQCRKNQTVEWHDRQIETVMSYADFLRGQKRDAEAKQLFLGLWKEYEHNQIARSKSIVSRLTEMAKVMKTVGLSFAALAIFKHVQSYYQSVNAQHSSSYSHIQQEVQNTSRDIISSTSSSTVSDSLLREIFLSSMTARSREVDDSGMTSAKMLLRRQMDEQRWMDAIGTIKTVLNAVWPSFLEDSPDSLTLTTVYLKECVDFIERLATCYHYQQRTDKVEDVYNRFFRAARSSRRVDDKVVMKTVDNLITFYRQHDKTEKLISLYQELLVDYCTVYGETSKTSIDTMYLLGNLCRQQPSTRNYWVEYYLQIISVLNNKSSEVSHPDAIEAMVTVGDYFWGDKRFAESLRVLRVMWLSFKQKPKDYKQFSDSTFVKTFVERYIQGLEETKTEPSIIYQTTHEYRDVCAKHFGQNSTITVQATLILARYCQKTERYQSESVTLYEELLKTNSSSINVTEVKSILRTLYSKVFHSSTDTSKGETATLERAMPFYQDRMKDTRSKYGLAHEETLSQLHEMTTYYFRHQKQDVAMQQMTSVMNEIMTKESSSSTRMVESAQWLAKIFGEINQTNRAAEITDEYHRQIVLRDSSNASKVGYNLTNSGRHSLTFLAALKYYLSSDAALSYSKVMADVTTEYLYYEQFRSVITSNETTELVFYVASRLYTFLTERQSTKQAHQVANDVVAALKKRESASVKGLTDSALLTFVITLINYLHHRQSRNFITSVALAGNERVRELLQSRAFREATDLAFATFQYVDAHAGYRHKVQLGFNLALLISGRNMPRCSDQKQYKEMLGVSQTVLRGMLCILEDLNINLAQIQLEDLNRVVTLTAEQQDWTGLEWLLTTLWTTREVQRTWPPSTTLLLGRRLVSARFLSHHRDEALRLAEAIAYNLRRVHGPRAPVTLDMNILLSTLDTSSGVDALASQNQSQGAELAKLFFRKAVAIHEDCLRVLVDPDMHADEDGDHFENVSVGASTTGNLANGHSYNEMSASFMTDGSGGPNADLVKQHLRLLKLAVQRLGGWPKDFAEYQGLCKKAFETHGAEMKGVEGVESWNLKGFGGGKAESGEGLFERPKIWDLLPEAEMDGK